MPFCQDVKVFGFVFLYNGFINSLAPGRLELIGTHCPITPTIQSRAETGGCVSQPECFIFPPKRNRKANLLS